MTCTKANRNHSLANEKHRLREIKLRPGEESAQGARQKEEGRESQKEEGSWESKKFATANPSVGGEEGRIKRKVGRKNYTPQMAMFDVRGLI